MIGVLGAATVAYLSSETPTPLYSATAKFVVQRGGIVGTPSLSDVGASQEMARSSADLIKTRPMLQQVIEELSLPYGPSTLSGKIRVSNPRSFIEINVTDPDPRMAATLANTVALNFINDFMSQQFRQISEFQDSLVEYGIVEDPNIVVAQTAKMTILRVAEDAIPPSGPSNLGTIGPNILTAMLLGLGLAAIVIGVLTIMDDRVKTPEDLRAAIGVLTLAARPRNTVGECLGV